MTHPIPLEALDQHVAIVGRTGSGKSYAARGAVERMLEDGRQVVVLDPTGVWWGLRAAADGSAAYAVAVIGGDRGDVPLPAEAGDALARHLVARRLSAVIDTSAFTLGARRRFHTAFLEHLYDANRSALHLVVDEADELAPQRPMPDQTIVLHRLDQIVRRGRVRGFRVVMITQRPAVLHKDVLSQAGTLVAMQLTAAQDRNAIGAWIEGQADRDEAKAMLAALPKLAVGNGFVWWAQNGPPALHAFPAIRTLDTGRTPDHGDEGGREALPQAEGLDLAGLRTAIAEPSEPNRAPEERRRADTDEVARLRGECARLEARVVALTEQLHRATSAIREAAAVLTPLAVVDGVIDTRKPREGDVIDVEQAGDRAPTPAPAAAPRRQPRSGSGRGGGAELRILRVLVAYGRALTMRQWATLAGMSATGGTWSTYVSRLRTRGQLDEGAGMVLPTAEGARAAGPVEPPPAPSAVRSLWIDRMGTGAAGRMLAALCDAYPRAMSRPALAAALGMSAAGGTFGTYLSRLVSNGLATRQPGGDIRASDDLFPRDDAP